MSAGKDVFEITNTLTRSRTTGLRPAAALIGCGHTTLRQWEESDSLPSLDSAAEWARAMGYRLTLEKLEA